MDVAWCSQSDGMSNSRLQAKALLASGDHGCSEEIATVIAMMQVQHIFVTPPNKRTSSQRAKMKFSCRATWT